MYKAIAANKRNTVLMMILFIILFTVIGLAVGLYYGDLSIAVLFVIGALLYSIFQYFLASKVAIAITGAKPIEKRDNERLYRIVENLAITTGLPTPKIYIINDPAPNAFATGRNPNEAIVAATTGLLSIMDDKELEAVMAHEMGHIANYDIRLSMIVFGLVSAIGLMVNIVSRSMFRDNNRNNPIGNIIGLVVVALAPLIAMIVQLAVSRQREYLADATSVLTTRYPDGLISAFNKFKQYGRPMQKQDTSSAHMFINDPLKKGFLGKMFSTHPPLDERIARLQKDVSRL